jgi:sec-independent protein translocase protein TatB
MLDIGWTELLLIGIIALIVVGPKDLPRMFRTLGRFTARARGMAREFQRAMDAAADESGVNDLARDLKDTASGKDLGLDELRDLTRSPKSWARDKVMGRRDAKGDAKGKATGDDGEAAADAADTADAAETTSKRAARGPATEALAQKRAAEAEGRRSAGAAARPAKPGAKPTAGNGADASPPKSTPTRAAGAKGKADDGSASKTSAGDGPATKPAAATKKAATKKAAAKPASGRKPGAAARATAKSAAGDRSSKSGDA